MSNIDLRQKLKEAIDLINRDLVNADVSEVESDKTQMIKKYKEVILYKNQLADTYKEVCKYYTELCETVITATVYEFYLAIAMRTVYILKRYISLIKISLFDNNLLDILNALSAALASDENKEAAVESVIALLSNMKDTLEDTLEGLEYFKDAESEGLIDSTARRYSVTNKITVLRMAFSSNSSLLTPTNALLTLTYKNDGNNEVVDKVIFSCPTIKIKNLVLNKRETVKKILWGLITITDVYYEGIVTDGDSDPFGIKLFIKNPESGNIFNFTNPNVTADKINESIKKYRITLKKGYAVKENTIQEPLRTYTIVKPSDNPFASEVKERTIYEDTYFNGTTENPGFYYLEDEDGKELSPDIDNDSQLFPVYRRVSSDKTITYFTSEKSNDGQITKYYYNCKDSAGNESSVEVGELLTSDKLVGVISKYRKYINVERICVTPVKDSEGAWTYDVENPSYDARYEDKLSYAMTTESSDGEEISIGTFTAKAPLLDFKRESDISIEFDADSFDLTNESALADYVNIRFNSNGGNIDIPQFSMDSASKEGDYYAFTQTVKAGATEAGFSSNSIPLKLLVKKELIAENKYQLSLDLGMNTDDDTIATDDTGYLSIGLLSFPEVTVEATTKVLNTEIGNEYDYNLAYSVGKLDNLITNNELTADSLYDVYNQFSLAINGAIEKINDLINRIYACLNTIARGESFRQSYDADAYIDNLSSVKSEIDSLEVSIKDSSPLDVDDFRKNVDSALYEEIFNKINNIYNETDDIMTTSLEELLDASKFIDTYAPVFGYYTDSGKIKISLSALIGIYAGATKFSSAMNYGGSPFIKMTLSARPFDYWCESLNNRFIDSMAEMELYYITKFILSKIDYKYLDYARKVLEIVYNHRLIDRKINFKKTYIDIREDEKNLAKEIGLIYTDYKNAYKLPSSLEDISTELNQFKNYDITNLFPYANSSVASSNDVVDYIFAKIIIKAKNQGKLDKIISEISERCLDLSSYRNILFLIYLEKSLTYLYQINFLSEDYLYKYSLPKLSDLNSYAKRYNKIYNIHKNIQIHNMLNTDSSNIESISKYLK